jgi:Uncharacterized protein conserved in bacteria (DUF2252)
MTRPSRRVPVNGLPDPEYLPKRTIGERLARGRGLRAELPHERLAAWAPPPTRVDPLEVLQRQCLERITDLIPIRYGRMATSQFAFFRGAAGVMAADLAGSPTCGLKAQLCGDAHLLNFGMFDTPERTLVFGLNDFDETLPGPVEWDIQRLAASVEVAGRDLELGGSERRAAVLATVRSYREAMLDFAELRNIEVWTSRLPAKELEQRMSQVAGHQTQTVVKKAMHKALRHDNLNAFGRLIEEKDVSSGLSARRPWWFRSTSCWNSGNGNGMSRCSACSWSSTARAFSRTYARCRSHTALPVWPARSSGWEAWAHGTGSSC